MEVFRPIPDFENLYHASNFGNILGLKRGKLLTQKLTKLGYMTIELTKCNKPYYLRVHRLVALAFLPNPNNLPVVDHMDGIKTNNNLSNLEWVDHKENTRRAVSMGLKKSKLDQSKADEIRLLKSEGYSSVELGEMFGVSRQSIIQVVNGSVYDDDDLVKIAHRKLYYR